MVLLFLFLLSVVFSKGQTMNLNPDPNGEPWTVSTVEFGISSGSCEPQVFTPNQASLNKPLPASVHNESHIWWPFIINQGAFNSCNQVAEIFYTFTYEINRSRNLNAGDSINDEYAINRYDHHYTYNQNVSGVNGGSDWHSGFCTVRDNGCPNYNTFHDDNVFYPTNSLENKTTYWMTGNENYEIGMKNRISEIYQFPFGIGTADLNHLKHWIADHGKGETTGGLAIIGVYMDGHSVTLVTQPPYDGEKILNLGSGGMPHALTIVGYDDNFPVSATEQGAFKIANSWGTLLFGYHGFAWVPYSALILNNPRINIPYAYTCDVSPTINNPINNPDITISASIDHPQRKQLWYYVGQDEIIDENPEVPNSTKLFDAFTKKGNLKPMRGTQYVNPIELSLNFSHYYTDNISNPFQRVFFNLYEDTNSIGGGQINSVKLVDHRWNTDFELEFDNANQPIVHENNWCYVDYYLLPHHGYHILTTTTLNTNRVSRFKTEVKCDYLTLAENKEIHMYDGEIVISYASTLRLLNGSKIIAKRGHNKLIFNGVHSIDPTSEIIVENGATLEVSFIGTPLIVKWLQFLCK